MTDTKNMNTVLKIYENFDKRVHGDYEQKITKKVEYSGGVKGILSESQVQNKMAELGVNNNTVVVYSENEKGKQDE